MKNMSILIELTFVQDRVVDKMFFINNGKTAIKGVRVSADPDSYHHQHPTCYSLSQGLYPSQKFRKINSSRLFSVILLTAGTAHYPPSRYTIDRRCVSYAYILMPDNRETSVTRVACDVQRLEDASS